MALVEGCTHDLEISIPAEAVDEETVKVTEQFRQKAQLKGFRAGKAPVALVKKNFAHDIRQRILENLRPPVFRCSRSGGTSPAGGYASISDVHFHEGEPLRFKARFEVFPEVQVSGTQRR